MSFPKIIAIIPARGGSQALPRKTARLLSGRSLVSYSLDAAQRSHKIDAVYLSTDDAELKGIGLGGFSRFHTAYFKGIPVRRSYPHNLWLEIASEQGLIGLIPLAILTVMGIWHLLRIRRDPDIALSRAVQMVFWISFFQTCYTSDLPMFRGYFGVLGLLAGYNLWLREQKAFEEMPMGPSEEGVVPSL